MPSYLLSPGAWLNPKDPPRSGNAAFNPKNSGKVGLLYSMDVGNKTRVNLRSGLQGAISSAKIVITSAHSGSESAEIVGFEVRTDGGKDLRKEIFQLAAQQNWPLVEMRREVVSLEDVFRRLTA